MGTKGLGAVSKIAKATTKVGVHKVKGAAQKIPTLNLYPYAPQHQLAGVNAGIVPYNTVNSVGLREQLISMAKVESKGIENVKQGDKSSLAPGGGLSTHELKGGHLIERHVGKTDEQLLERLKTNPKLTGSSTFKDRMTAEKVANTVLSDSKNIGKIKKWISDPHGRPTLPSKYKGDGEIIGRSVSRNSKIVENVTNAKVILKKNSDGSFILTGYPVK